MASVNRISAIDTKAMIDADLALLVCLYDDPKFSLRAHLEGAIPMSKFLRMKPDLDLDTQIIFY
ncbi:MAG: hypothetical protein ABIJ59_00925 [Pseudomonadota bacterium]